MCQERMQNLQYILCSRISLAINSRQALHASGEFGCRAYLTTSVDELHSGQVSLFEHDQCSRAS